MLESIEKYKVFYITAKTGNISKAAELLYVSQPAISKSIKELEYHKNCKFFIRSNKGVQLTSEGEIFFKYVEKAFENLLDGEIILEKLLKKEEGIVRIGISNTLCRYYLMSFIEKFHEKYSGIKIQIINRNSSESIQLLKSGKVDFVITSRIPETNNFQVQGLFSIHDIFVINKKTEELSGIVNIEVLKNYPLIMLERKNETREYLEKFFNNKLELNPEIEIGSIDFLVEFARIGLGISAVIKEFVQSELNSKKIYEIKIKPSIPKRIVNLIYLSNVPFSNAAKAFLEMIYEI